MTQITFTLERLIGGTVLLLMLGLVVLTFGTPTRADANAPIIVMPTRVSQRAAEPTPAPTAGAEPTPALAMPAALLPPTAVPTAEPTPAPPVAVVVEVSPPPVESQLVVESDGHVRLPGVDDWYTPPPPPEPTAAPVVSAPLPPRGDRCGSRCGWQPRRP